MPCFPLAIPGRPRPNVTWYLDNSVIDESFETRPDGTTVNHLSYPNIGRQHLDARLMCVASNTNLTPPNNKVVVLDVNRKYLLTNSSFPSARACVCAYGNELLKRNDASISTVKPVAVHIMAKEKFVSADKRYEIECKSSGSRPEAAISWWKGTRMLKRVTKNVSMDEDPRFVITGLGRRHGWLVVCKRSPLRSPLTSTVPNNSIHTTHAVHFFL